MLEKQITPYGEWIKRWRMSKGYYISTMAQKLNMAQNYLRDIESGVEPIPDNFEDALSAALSLNEVDLEDMKYSVGQTRKLQEQEEKELLELAGDLNGVRIPTIVVELDDGAVMPTKAHTADAGYDLYANEDCEVWSQATKTIGTGVHMFIREGYCGLVCPRSGMISKKDLVARVGVIDAGYTGEIKVALHLASPVNYHRAIKKGDRIAQLLILPVIAPDFIEGKVTKMISERGNDGFGSSGD